MDFSSVIAGLGAGIGGFQEGVNDARLRERAAIEDERRREREDHNLELSKARESRAAQSHEQNLAISKENLRRMSASLDPMANLFFNTLGGIARDSKMNLDTRNASLGQMGNLIGQEFPKLEVAPPSDIELRKLALSERRSNQSQERSVAGENRALTTQYRANVDQLNKLKGFGGVIDQSDPEVQRMLRENELIRQKVYSNTGVDIGEAEAPREQQQQTKKKLGVFSQ